MKRNPKITLEDLDKTLQAYATGDYENISNEFIVQCLQRLRQKEAYNREYQKGKTLEQKQAHAAKVRTTYYKKRGKEVPAEKQVISKGKQRVEPTPSVVQTLETEAVSNDNELARLLNQLEKKD